MTDLKTLKKELYATPLDIRILSSGSIMKETHSDNIHKDDPRVELALLQARGIIDLKLGRKFSGVSTLEVTPFAGPPLIPKADDEGSGENSGSKSLYGIQVADTAYTELWTITFTDADNISVVGSFSGSQGTGAIASDFTSTNSDITIPSDAWAGTAKTDDKIYVPVYKHHQSIVILATMLAAGLIFKGMNTGAMPDANPEGAQLYNDALKLLDDIVADKAGLLDVNFSVDSSDLMIPYEISIYGNNITGYQADEFDRYKSEGSLYYNYPWYLW